MADMKSAESPAPAGGRGRLILKIAVGVAALAVLFLLGRQLGGYVPQFAEWVHSLGFWGPIVFIGGYILATVAFIPGSILTLAAGAIFGLLRGTAYVFIGATAGSILAFLVSRYGARERIERRVQGNKKFEAIDRAVGAQGFKIVLLLRLSPVFPFNLLNYALGLTKVSLRDYALAAAGMLPGTFLYVYYGKLAGDVAALAGGVKVEKGPAYWTVLVLGLVATVVVTAIVTRIARKALKEYE
ncbi:MAG: TVP38/TMEM64 family protein [Acidobacteriota bacterium]